MEGKNPDWVFVCSVQGKTFVVCFLNGGRETLLLLLSSIRKKIQQKAYHLREKPFSLLECEC